MALQRLDEPLNGGYVNTRGASTLERGELSGGINMTYSPSSLAISVAGAPAIFQSLTGGTLIGLRWLKFASTTDFGFVQNTSATSYYYFNGSTWVGIGSTITLGTDLDHASYNGRHYIFNGANANQVVYLNGSTKSMRRHGLQPVTTAPTLSTTEGTWPWEVGVYEYWITEVAEITEGSSTLRLESDFTGTPATVTTIASSAINIVRPTMVNASTTRWRVYRAGPRVSDSIALFPVGQLLVELPVATTSFTDGSVTDTGFLRPTTAATTGSTWANTAGVTAGTLADSGTGTGSATSYTNVTPPGDTITVYGYATTAVKDPIAGIALYVRLRSTGTQAGNGSAVPYVQISVDGGSTFSASRGMAFGEGGWLDGSGTSETTTPGARYTLGGPTDTWGLTLTAANAGVANNVRVKLSMYDSEALQPWYIDDIRIRLYYGGAENEPSGAFPYFSLSVDGASTSGSMLGSPPVSSTGAIFEDSMVVNDTSSPGIIRYSPAGQPEYFPSLYYMRLDVGAAEPITAIHNVGGRLIAATARSLYRVNFLPRTFDASFDRGRPVEVISETIGIYGPKTCTTMTNPANGRPALFFIGNDGNLYITDGFEIRSACPDITLSVSQLPGMFVINDPLKQIMQVFYGASTYSDSRIELHYHPLHLKAGGMKASVPIELTDKFASGGISSTGSIMLGHHTTASDSAHTYSIGSGQGGTSFGSGAYAITRRIWPTGVAHEARLDAVYLSDDGLTLNGVYSLTPLVSLTNTVEATLTASTKSFATLSPPLIRFEMSTLVEGVRLKLAMSSADSGFAKWNWAMLEYEDFNRGQSGA